MRRTTLIVALCLATPSYGQQPNPGGPDIYSTGSGVEPASQCVCTGNGELNGRPGVVLTPAQAAAHYQRSDPMVCAACCQPEAVARDLIICWFGTGDVYGTNGEPAAGNQSPRNPSSNGQTATGGNPQPPSGLPSSSCNTSGAAGLWIAGSKIISEQDFNISSLLQTQDASETALRRKIFYAMKCNPHRHFQFASPPALGQNILLREQLVNFMTAVAQGSSNLSFLVGGGAAGSGFRLPQYWDKYADPNQWNGQPLASMIYPFQTPTGPKNLPMSYGTTTLSAHDSIQMVRNEGAAVDCYGGVELAVLEAVDSVLGTQLNALHPPTEVGFFQRPETRSRTLFGLGIGLISYTINTVDNDIGSVSVYVTPPAVNSVAKHLIVVRYHAMRSKEFNRDKSGKLILSGLDQYDTRSGLAGPIEMSDMVPGDYGYLENPLDYAIINPNGAYYGENTIYLGGGQFYGLGISGTASEATIRKKLADDYNQSALNKRSGIPANAVATAIPWTRLASPSLTGDPNEAGYFVPGH